ncbi:MAG: UvrD-helicase domain-containing protein, partial [Trueperaceae bacterium]|nr:UvrD-helicase domain-containing protein [Trueperaceae bacterium]
AHHDDAYRWAERRKIEVHPVTGAAQLVEVREVVRQVERIEHVEPAVVSSRHDPVEPPLFADIPGAELASYGVPEEWAVEVRTVTESGLFELLDHLPPEAAEALFVVATGETPTVAPSEPDRDPYEHPAARRRFLTVTGEEELRAALDYPWEKWTVFLHPAQRDLVERDYGGPARVSGSAGTGKTVVALHRAVHLTEVNPDARVLLSTFSPALAEQLRVKLRRLLATKPRLGERIDIEALDDLAARAYRTEFGRAPRIADPREVRSALREAAGHEGLSYSESFLVSEWDQVVDAWQLRDWEAYRSVQRLGRKVRLPEAARARLWAAFASVLDTLEARKVETQAAVYHLLAAALAKRARPMYEHVVLDEAQDASATQLRFLATLVGDRPNGLFFAGDLGQRIFQQPFSWLSVGVDIRGRSRTLKVNYRTSQQIRRRADRLLDERTEDVDGEHQERSGTVSVFSGPEPEVRLLETQADESAAVGAWLRDRLHGGTHPEELAVFVRSESQLPRAERAVRAAGMAPERLDDAFRAAPQCVAVATMHRAKGLEYKAVAVMACDEGVLPLASREEAAADMVELKEINETERQLLYVALTRARDELLVTGVRPESVYLQDI